MPIKAKDLSGQKFGMLTVLKEDIGNDYINPNTGKHVKRYLCKCDCGNLRSVTAGELISGHAWNCGCKRNNVLKDLTGQTFGKLTVIERADSRLDKYGRKVAYWRCKCLCGKVTEVRGAELTSGHTKSCGCGIAESSYRHGLYGTRIYSIHQHMLQRCYNPNNEHYKDYGGRGIKVCEEWHNENGVVNFYHWAMNNGYNDNLTIDRIDVDGNYCPENCRWVDYKTQNNNKRNTPYIAYNGETHTPSEWADITGISMKAIYDRIIRDKWPVEKALATPVFKSEKYITYEGITMTYSDWERARGFRIGTISNRLIKGASIEDALNMPIAHSKDSIDPINAIYFVDQNDKPIICKIDNRPAMNAIYFVDDNGKPIKE